MVAPGSESSKSSKSSERSRREVDVQRFLELVENEPVIASVKDAAGMAAALRSDRPVLFVLYGTVLDIAGIIEEGKAAGKLVFVNVDLLDGFAAREVVVSWLAEHTRADGILSTKATLIRAARRSGLLGVHRVFLVDSFSYDQVPRLVEQSRPDALEILPGCVPRVITWLRRDVDVPVIAGGLVCDKADVMAALAAGACAVASSNREVWAM